MNLRQSTSVRIGTAVAVIGRIVAQLREPRKEGCYSYMRQDRWSLVNHNEVLQRLPINSPGAPSIDMLPTLGPKAHDTTPTLGHLEP